MEPTINVFNNMDGIEGRYESGSFQAIDRILTKCNGDCGNVVANVIECCIQNKDFPSNYKQALSLAFYDYSDGQRQKLMELMKAHTNSLDYDGYKALNDKDFHPTTDLDINSNIIHLFHQLSKRGHWYILQEVANFSCKVPPKSFMEELISNTNKNEIQIKRKLNHLNERLKGIKKHSNYKKMIEKDPELKLSDLQIFALLLYTDENIYCRILKKTHRDKSGSCKWKNFYTHLLSAIEKLNLAFVYKSDYVLSKYPKMLFHGNCVQKLSEKQQEQLSLNTATSFSLKWHIAQSFAMRNGMIIVITNAHLLLYEGLLRGADVSWISKHDEFEFIVLPTNFSNFKVANKKKREKLGIISSTNKVYYTSQCTSAYIPKINYKHSTIVIPSDSPQRNAKMTLVKACGIIVIPVLVAIIIMILFNPFSQLDEWMQLIQTQINGETGPYNKRFRVNTYEDFTLHSIANVVASVNDIAINPFSSQWYILDAHNPYMMVIDMNTFEIVEKIKLNKIGTKLSIYHHNNNVQIAITHSGFITFYDGKSKTGKTINVPIARATSLVYGYDNYAYVTPAGQHAYVYQINSTHSLQCSKLHDDIYSVIHKQTIYGLTSGTHRWPRVMYKFSICTDNDGDSCNIETSEKRGYSDYEMGFPFWFSHDGTALFLKTGLILRSTDDDQDMSVFGTFSNVYHDLTPFNPGQIRERSYRCCDFFVLICQMRYSPFTIYGLKKQLQDNEKFYSIYEYDWPYINLLHEHQISVTFKLDNMLYEWESFNAMEVLRSGTISTLYLFGTAKNVRTQSLHPILTNVNTTYDQ